MVFMMESSLLYSHVRSILVHDVESCYFPGEEYQPENARSLFLEKAVSFLRGNGISTSDQRIDYSESATAQIIQKASEPRVTKKKQDPKEDEHIETRVFLR